MATTEDTRRQLFETVRANLGEPAAEALMAVTIPANTDLATRQDLDLLRAELHADRAELRVEMEGLRGDLTAHRAETTAELAKHRAETTAELGKLTASVERLRAELYRWFLPAVTAVVGLVTYLTR
jgi:hypothetical protein